MLDDLLHIDDGHTLITAATVGVSLRDWIALASDTATPESSLKLMKQHKLDVIPLIASDGNAYEYYCISADTKSPDRQVIRFNQTLPSNAHIKDVIKAFVSTKRKFFFLRNKGEIGGIVSLADLNNRQVKTYLYGLLCDLETDLSLFVKNNVTEADIVGFLEKTVTEQQAAQKSSKEWGVLQRYKRDAEDDMQIHLTEYLYLSHSFDLIEHGRLLDGPLMYSKENWDTLSRGINDIRNIIAHPVQPLIQHAGELESLYQHLESIYDLNFRLRYWNSTQLA